MLRSVPPTAMQLHAGEQPEEKVPRRHRTTRHEAGGRNTAATQSGAKEQTSRVVYLTGLDASSVTRQLSVGRFKSQVQTQIMTSSGFIFLKGWRASPEEASLFFFFFLLPHKRDSAAAEQWE
ncbi:hypothetical protein EYF80_042277 [Liparis tanakae]|uniref:Uncharacterized protein n=1 Tax=Liparis tanakae TaxID=230148 RepID=A0A4Z2G2V6_9TELE|nr:hypothetical protein EYF80_042277 [Liparis tanakae]